MKAPDRIVVYGHPACGMVSPVKQLLRAAQVPFDYVDIHADAAARRWVRAVNQGYESVPTLAFPDGSTLTEPSPSTLRRKLRELGYEISPFRAWLSYLVGNPLYYVLLALSIYWLLRLLDIL